MGLPYLPACKLQTTKMTRGINIKTGGELKLRLSKGEREILQ